MRILIIVMGLLMGLIQTVPPYAEPLHLTEVKNHLKVEETADDLLISDLMRTARERAELATGKQLVTATWQWTLDRFPCVDVFGSQAMRVPRPPLLAVDSISYVDSAGDSQTWTASLYQVDAAARPGRIQPAYGQVYPTTRNQLNAVTVTYRAGFLTPFTAVAGTDVCTAQGRTLANGDQVRLSNSGGALPAGLSLLIDYYVVEASGSTFKLALTAGGAAVDITDTGSGTSFVGLLPSALRSAMLLLVGHWYRHREDVQPGGLAALPMGAEPLLAGEWSGSYE